jgi:hypothetical protein
VIEHERHRTECVVMTHDTAVALWPTGQMSWPVGHFSRAARRCDMLQTGEPGSARRFALFHAVSRWISGSGLHQVLLNALALLRSRQQPDVLIEPSGIVVTQNVAPDRSAIVRSRPWHCVLGWIRHPRVNGTFSANSGLVAG